MLSIWHDYIIALWIKKKDIRNPYYFYTTPEDLMRKHGKAINAIKVFDYIKQAQRDSEIFMELNGRFIGLKMVDIDGLEIMTLNSPVEYIEESARMHNCIGSLKYYIKKDSLILVARRNGKSIADIELDLNTWKIRQCFGPCNKPTPDEKQIENLIYKNLEEIQRRYFRA